MPFDRIFAWVGITFGAMFVVINSSDLPGAWAWTARALGVALAVIAIVRGVRRAAPGPVTDDRSGARVYWTAVAAEVIAIPVGSWIISQVFERPDLTVIWVVFVVGAHFLPARMFGFPQWSILGLVMIAIAIAGAISAVAFDEVWAAAAAVLAGYAMLVFVASANRSQGAPPGQPIRQYDGPGRAVVLDPAAPRPDRRRTSRDQG